MPKRLYSPLALGGYGTILITLVIFFAQGGLGAMSMTSLAYAFFLLVGVALVLYSVVNPNAGNTVGAVAPANEVAPQLSRGDEWEHFDYIKEAMLKVDSASTKQAKELSDTSR